MTITPDQPDWTGYTINAPDARLVASGTHVNGVFTVVVNLLPTDRSLAMFWTAVGGPVVLTSAVGATTGLDYAPFADAGLAGDLTNRLTSMPAFGVLDSTITLTLNSSGTPVKWFIMAVPDAILIGGPATPGYVQLSNQAVLHVSQPCPSGSTTAVLTPPGPGNAWRIKLIGARGGAATVVASPRFLYHTGGHELLSANSAVGQLTALQATPDMVVNDGIDFANATGVTVQAFVSYQVVVPQS